MAPQGGSTSTLPGTRTTYDHIWYDTARQSKITFDADTGSSSNALNTSTFSYDVNGRLAYVNIKDGRPRNVTFVSDTLGQVLSRTEADNNAALADPVDVYSYYDGVRVGAVTNNADWSETYVSQVGRRLAQPSGVSTPFLNGTTARHGADNLCPPEKSSRQIAPTATSLHAEHALRHGLARSKGYAKPVLSRPRAEETSMFSRRAFLATSAAAVLTPALPVRAARPGFVTRDGMALMLDGRPYRFVGANAWYLAWLGADADFGDRARLARELDALQADGVTNLRVGASAELSPLKNSVRPAFRDQSPEYNETLLVGLDQAMAEIGRRGMKAVLYLTNFWEWSGGMMTYLSWVNGGRYLDMNDPAHPWPAFPDFIADFYRSDQAVALYHDYVRVVVTRTNTVTGIPYAEDPALMAWQLANEPRPAGGEAEAVANLPAFYDWINGTARLIKSLDPNHLVSTGGEGLKGSVERPQIVLDSQRSPDIDYMTAHIWPGNWGWLDRKDMAATDAAARALSRDYVAQHIGFARQLNKPLVIEEFGYPRDGDAYDPAMPASLRDGFYDDIHAAVLADAQAGGPLVGSNYWAWNGEARSPHPDHRFRSGDRAWMGDPPHEPQGWYGVFDTDRSTRDRIRIHAAALAAV